MNLMKYVYNNKINKKVLNDPTKLVSDCNQNYRYKRWESILFNEVRRLLESH